MQVLHDTAAGAPAGPAASASDDKACGAPAAGPLESCVRCGSCKAQCPTYAEDAAEGMGARGRVMLLRQLAEGALEPSETLEHRIFSCLLCGACTASCPLGVDVTEALYEGRARLRRLRKSKDFLGLGLRLGLKRAPSSIKVLRFFQDMGEVFPLHRIPPFRQLKALGIIAPDASLRDGASLYKAARPKARIAVFAGCTVNFLYPHIGHALIRSLNALHYDVVLPKGEVCCGAPLRGLGFEDDAIEMAERNIAVFRKMNVEAVIGLCPTCVHTVRDEYRKRGGDGIDNAVEVARFFSDKAPQLHALKGRTEGGQQIVYHEPCHSRYSLSSGKEPQRLLASLGVPPVEAEQGCCGFGGPFRVLYPDLAEALLEKRAAAYRHAEVIATSCPNCILQLRSGMKDKSIKHLIEVIDETITG